MNFEPLNIEDAYDAFMLKFHPYIVHRSVRDNECRRAYFEGARRLYHHMMVEITTLSERDAMQQYHSIEQQFRDFVENKENWRYPKEGGQAQEFQSPQIPEVGRNIPWTDVIRQVFRVIEFDRAGTSVEAGNRVKPLSASAPYGYLVVESPILNQRIRLPIVHRDDFLLAASVFDEPQWTDVAKTEELLVTYVPKHKLPGGFAGVSHALHYVLTPRGTLERYYLVNGGEHMGRPAPEKLFGSFVWAEEIRVGVNANPSV